MGSIKQNLYDMGPQIVAKVFKGFELYAKLLRKSISSRTFDEALEFAEYPIRTRK